VVVVLLLLLLLMMSSSSLSCVCCRYAADVFNVGSDTSYSVSEMYQHMCTVAGKSISPEFKDPSTFWDKYDQLFTPSCPLSRERVKKEVYKNSQADNSKARREFQWAPKTDIVTGLTAVYNYALQAMTEHGGITTAAEVSGKQQ
jgi:nucleoside-diphosphate-sugar epimerase